MDHDNILAINIPNAISITLMALVGGFIAAAVRKAALARMNGGNQQAGVPGQ